MGWQDAPIVDPSTVAAPVASAAPDTAPTGDADAPAWSRAPIVSSSGAPATALPPEHHGLLESLGHQLGLTLRAAVVGSASVPAIVSDAVTGPINAGLDTALGKGNGFRFMALTHAVDDLLTRAGVPNPENATERVVQAAAQAAAGGATGAGIGKVAASLLTGEVSQAVASQLGQGIGMQAVSGATGAGAAQEVKEKGGSPGAQIAANVVGSLAPGVVPFALKEGAKALVRGGEEGRQAMADRIATFDSAGVDPTMGQAADTRLARSAESLLSKIPGGAGVMAKKAEQQADQLQVSVQQVADALAPGADATTAGEAIMRGVQQFRDGFKNLQAKLYQRLDAYIPSDTPIQVGNTEFALKQLNEDIDGAPALSQFFKNSKIVGIDKALQSDLEQAADTGTLPYQAVKQLRTLVGNELADHSLLSDVPRSKWSSLYGALSDDLGQAAQAAGPDAQSAWKWANGFTRTQLSRLEELSSVLSKDAPEKVFSAAISGTAEGDTVVRRVVSALPKSDRRELAAAVIQRLGRATPGQQNSDMSAFSSETFLTNLSKMSMAARQTIFGRTDVDGILDRVNTLAAVADSRRNGARVFNNPSGTATAASQITGVVAPVAALASGQYKAAAGMLATSAGAYGTAKAMVNPQSVRDFATSTQFAPGTQAAAVEAAARAGQQVADRKPLAMALTPMRDRPAWARAPRVEDVLGASNIDDAIAAAAKVAQGGGRLQSLIAQIPPTSGPSSPAPVASAPAAPPPAAAKEPAFIASAPTRGKQPDDIWTGRRGGGYLDVNEAELMLPSREKARPDLSWRVEKMANGRFRLAGYSK